MLLLLEGTGFSPQTLYQVIFCERVGTEPSTKGLSDTDSDSRGGEGSPLESEGFRQTRGRFSKLSNEVWSAWGLFRHTMGH